MVNKQQDGKPACKTVHAELKYYDTHNNEHKQLKTFDQSLQTIQVDKGVA